ncbi:hypothetical protein Tco_0602287 [Tanacetum coccineum]
MGSWFSCILPKNKGPYHTDLPTPEEIHQFLQFQRVDPNRTIKSKNVILLPNQVLTKELRQDLKRWEELIRENVIESARASPKGHLPYGDDDEDDGDSRASTPSPTTYLNSLKPLNHQQYNIPTSSEQDDDLLFERQTEFCITEESSEEKEMKTF